MPAAYQRVKAAVKKRTARNSTTGQMFTVHTDRDGNDCKEPKLRASATNTVSSSGMGMLC